MSVITSEVSTVESTSIIDFLGGLIPSSNNSLATADWSWLSGVMIGDFIIGTAKMLHVKGFLNLLRLNVGSGWASFDMKHLSGTYYEIAYHDATQPAPVCGCQRIVRTWNETT
jgi:hypothetical protein